MVRKFIFALAVAIVYALLAVPADPGRAQASGKHGSHRHHHPSRPFSGFIYAPDPFPYGFLNCWWEEGHWVEQFYIDKSSNLKAAKALGLTIPPSLLGRADDSLRPDRQQPPRLGKRRLPFPSSQ